MRGLSGAGRRTSGPGRWFGLALRIGISMGLLWLVMRTLSVEEMLDRLATADLRYMALALVLLVLNTIFASVRWRRVCHLVRCRFGLLVAWRTIMMATTLDQFVLNASGDAIRIWWLSRRGLSITHAVSGTVLDRTVGAFALVLLIAAGLPVLVTVDAVGDYVLLPAAMVLAGAAGVAGLIVLNRLPIPAFRFKANVAVLSDLTRTFFLSWRRDALVAMSAAVAVHVCVALAFAAIGAGLGLGLSVWVYLLATPPAMLVALLPISVGGWGVREGSIVVALGLAGATSSDALLTSVLFGLGVTVIGVLGGLVWLFGFPQDEADPSPSDTSTPSS